MDQFSTVVVFVDFFISLYCTCYLFCVYKIQFWFSFYLSLLYLPIVLWKRERETKYIKLHTRNIICVKPKIEIEIKILDVLCACVCLAASFWFPTCFLHFHFFFYLVRDTVLFSDIVRKASHYIFIDVKIISYLHWNVRFTHYL